MDIAAIVFRIIIVIPFKAFPVIQHLYRKSAPFQIRANLEPLSALLQHGFRFFQHPLPACLSASFTGRFPYCYGDNRVYHVPLILPNDLGLAYPPEESQTTQYKTGLY